VDPEGFFAATRLVIVAGKGGVGKTTVAAALARTTAGTGRRVLVATLEPAGGLGPLLGLAHPITEDAQPVPGMPTLWARALTASHALHEYLDDHGLRRLAGRLVRSGVLDVVATAAPGIDDLLVLGKLKALERSGEWDLVVLDAPAAGHAITFLQAPRALADSVNAGPISTQAKDVLELLGDPDRCQVVLVTLAEETPVNELIETAYALEDKVGVQLGPIVVNALYPAIEGLGAATDRVVETAAPSAAADATNTDNGLEAAATFRRERVARQTEQVERLGAALALPQVHLPFLFRAGLDAADLAVLADHLGASLGAFAS
jgi:anion-transporting  ArsA/GET3 family ATPase